MNITDLTLPGLRLLTPARFEDERGFFMETFRESEFTRLNFPVFVQSNHSRSHKNVLRGLHFQLNPQSQGKLVRCVSGVVFDVAVDIRRGSPSFGQWLGVELSGSEGSMLYVPPGFAHGFCVLSDQADVVYQQTAYYSPELQRGIRWDDPELGIEWPVDNPLLSPADSNAPGFAEVENNFVFSDLD